MKEGRDNMRIAVITEVSTADKNSEIMRGLESSNHQIFNLGMKSAASSPHLTTVETGFMSAVVLNLKCVDLVIGGCGTGQGYMNSVLQYPGVVCGLITNPLDAWLFSQINAGNCISLALNKGYGWAGEINLKYIFEHLLETPAGGGYPKERKEPQRQIRNNLRAVSEAVHYPIENALKVLDQDMVEHALKYEDFYKFIFENGQSDIPLYKEIKQLCEKIVAYV